MACDAERVFAAARRGWPTGNAISANIVRKNFASLSSGNVSVWISRFDPELPFKFGRMNGRDAPRAGILDVNPTNVERGLYLPIRERAEESRVERSGQHHGKEASASEPDRGNYFTDGVELVSAERLECDAGGGALRTCGEGREANVGFDCILARRSVLGARWVFLVAGSL